MRRNTALLIIATVAMTIALGRAADARPDLTFMPQSIIATDNPPRDAGAKIKERTTSARIEPHLIRLSAEPRKPSAEFKPRLAQAALKPPASEAAAKPRPP